MADKLCGEITCATTFKEEEEAVLWLAAGIAKKHVENGDIEDFDNREREKKRLIPSIFVFL
ncbi:hypothetical protein HR13_07020 [Porphyromonas gulae]|nr:hypothetical protein HR09_04460 [Porphyromonas gulae]KGN79489.1 hypothetical protein HR13_07020 [Porphyromonas gulae]KGO03546.1 hypothetical protein HQ42_00425 [Porphyromonas gulae]